MSCRPPFADNSPPKKSLKELSRNHLTRVFVSSMAYLRNFLLIFPLSLFMSGLVRDEDKSRRVGGKSLLETSPSGTLLSFRVIKK